MYEHLLTFSICCHRLIDEGKLLDALALSDRFLRNGASDHLLQMLIVRAEDDAIAQQTQSSSALRIWSNSWQYCLRLKDKQLAARLALKYDYWFSSLVFSLFINFYVLYLHLYIFG